MVAICLPVLSHCAIEAESHSGWQSKSVEVRETVSAEELTRNLSTTVEGWLRKLDELNESQRAGSLTVHVDAGHRGPHLPQVSDEAMAECMRQRGQFGLVDRTKEDLEGFEKSIVSELCRQDDPQRICGDKPAAPCIRLTTLESVSLGISEQKSQFSFVQPHPQDQGQFLLTYTIVLRNKRRTTTSIECEKPEQQDEYQRLTAQDYSYLATRLIGTRCILNAPNP